MYGSIPREVMMSKSVVYAGVDVGASELWVSVAGNQVKSFCHCVPGIRSLYRWVTRHAGKLDVHICIEATGVYSQHLAYRILAERGAVVSLVNPACIHAFARAQSRRSKTDRIDAEVIRQYAETQDPPVWQPPTAVVRQLYTLVQQADVLKANLRQWENRRHTQQFMIDLPDAVKKSQRAMERSIQRQLENIERAIERLCAEETELTQQILLLETIPGVARTSAVKLIAYGQHWLTQRSAKELVAYAGLAPHQHQSGTSVRRRGRIDKQGNQHLRTALYMPALSGITHNPQLKRFYHRLCSSGKPKKVALTACMKKLLVLARAILINKKAYNPALT